MQTIAEKVLSQHPNLDEYENPWEDAFRPTGKIHPLSEGIKLDNGDTVQIDSGYACCWIDGSILLLGYKKWHNSRFRLSDVVEGVDEDEWEAILNEVLDKLFERFVEMKGSETLLLGDLADFCGISFEEAAKLVRKKGLDLRFSTIGLRSLTIN